MGNDPGFPQPRLTRAELRKMLNDIVDSMVDRLPIAQDVDAQASGYIDLAELKMEQVRPAPHEGSLNLNHVLKIEIFPERKDVA